MGRLTATKLRNTKPGAKVQKLFDGHGLYLEVRPNGSTLWRHKYRFNGKEQLLSLGKYPDVSLAQAREQHREQRGQLGSGVNPSTARRTKGENTFHSVADRWFAINSPSWSEAHAKRARFRLLKDINPEIGHYPVADVTPPIVLQCLRKIEGRGVHNTVHRCKGLIGQIMRFGIGEGLTDRDPTADLRGVLKPKPKPTHRAAVTAPTGAKQEWGRVYASNGNRCVRGVLLMALLTLQRNTEIRSMRWADIEGDAWVNHISKTEVDLSVPLPSQAMEILDEMRGWDDVYVFPGRGQEGLISVVAPLNYLRNIGYDTKQETTMHGFRAMGRTILVEELEYPEQWVEQEVVAEFRTSS